MVACLICLVVLALGAWRLYPHFNPTTYRLTMSTGSFSGANYNLAQQYLVPAAAAQKVALNFVETAGSQDTLDAVQQGKVQVALVDGGLGSDGRENVREIAPLFTTGLHVLVKPELYPEALRAKDFRTFLRGKRVSLSNVGSGTRVMSLVLLKALGVPLNEIVDDPKTVNFLVDPKTTVDQIPDVVMAASLLPSPVAARLMGDFDYQLLPFDEIDAYRLVDKNAYGLGVPAGTYQLSELSPARPPSKVTILGRRILLVANESVPDEAVTRLAAAVFESDFARAYDPPLTLKQFDLISEFPRHPGAQEYFESRSPVTQDSLATLVVYITGISAVIVCLPVFVFVPNLVRKMRLGDKLVSVNDYLAWVSEIEAKAQSLEEEFPTPAGMLKAELDLRHKLSQLKLDAMERYRSGLLADPDHMENLLAHISDTRIHLNSLIQATEARGGSSMAHAPDAESANGSAAARGVTPQAT